MITKKKIGITVAIILGVTIVKLALHYGEKELYFAKRIFENGKVIQIGSEKYELPYSWAVNKIDDNYVTIFHYSSPNSIYYLPYYFNKAEFTKLSELAKKYKELKVEGCSEVYLMDKDITLYLNKSINVAISFVTGQGKKLPELCRWLEYK